MMSSRRREMDEGLGRRPSSSGNIPSGTRCTTLRADASLPSMGFAAAASGPRGSDERDARPVCRSWSEIVMGPSPGVGSRSGAAAAEERVPFAGRGEEDTGSKTEHRRAVDEGSVLLGGNDTDTDADVGDGDGSQQGEEEEEEGDMEY